MSEESINPEAPYDAADEAELPPDYTFDFSNAKPNRFATAVNGDVRTVALDPDVAKVFKTAEAVNKALRAILEAMPNAESLSKAA